MRSFLPLLSIAAASGTAFAQEAARFGVVNVFPTTVRFDQPITITYNTSTARSKPIAVDFYLEGTQPNGAALPTFTLARLEDMQNVSYVTFQRNLPVIFESPTNGYQQNDTFAVWAFITFPEPSGGAFERGGTSAGLQVLLE
ncbi:hypothetical protein EIP86_002053 [Pleurotus ostreatoroseus]|nr:hypothetical protein EIP86_002053 [Pleurotus ostreatoroseus]